MSDRKASVVDVRHPISEKIVKNETGMTIMSTDMGSIE